MQHMTSSAFDGEQFSSAYPAGMELHWWHRARNNIVARELALQLPAGARLLEIGCGPGIVIDGLLRRGWDAWGVDLGTPAPLGSAEQRVKLGMSATNLPRRFRESVSCLLFLDVIEHIERVPEFLAEILSAFTAARTVVITVPARQEVWSNYDTYYGHFRRYTPETLRAELGQGGLTVSASYYFFHSLYLAALLLQKAGRQRSVHLSAPKSILPQRIVGAWLRAESAILASTPLPGLSLLAVAESNR
jgi:hypothetical protein